MMPFGFFTACSTIEIITSDNPIAAKFLDTDNNGMPVGLIGSISSSNSVVVPIPMEAQDFFNSHLTSTSVHSTFGEMISSTYNSMLDKYYSGDGNVVADSWKYFGDPSVNSVFSRNCPNTKTVSLELSASTYEVLTRLQLKGQNLISNGATVIYGATNEVNLLPGFKVQNGCTFRATNNGCSLPPNADETNMTPFINVQREVSNMSAYPNPITNGYLNVNSDNDMPITISIYNILGVLIYKDIKPAKTNLIEIKFAGIYVVSIEMPTERLVHKIIVQ
jgi:hypothetical protein